MYALGVFVGMRFPGPFRLLIPILVVAYVAPFVAGPERLARVMRGRRTEPGVIIDVTPRPVQGLPEPPRTVPPDEPPRTVSPDDQEVLDPGGHVEDDR